MLLQYAAPRRLRIQLSLLQRQVCEDDARTTVTFDRYSRFSEEATDGGANKDKELLRKEHPGNLLQA